MHLQFAVWLCSIPRRRTPHVGSSFSLAEDPAGGTCGSATCSSKREFIFLCTLSTVFGGNAFGKGLLSV